jgi:uncharacterized membrane protein YhaH (DUF805 family)
MFGSIGYNLSHLLDFKGRDARQTFWYFVLFVVVLYFIASMLALIPMMGSVMGEAIQSAQSGATEQETQERVLHALGPQLATSIWISAITNLVATLLLMASFVRRLHDSGNSGWWAVLALVIKLGALALAVSQIGEVQEAVVAASDPAQLQQMGMRDQNLLGLVGWLAPIIVIVFGVMKSTDGPNRYGEAPVVF